MGKKIRGPQNKTVQKETRKTSLCTCPTGWRGAPLLLMSANLLLQTHKRKQDNTREKSRQENLSNDHFASTGRVLWPKGANSHMHLAQGGRELKLQNLEPASQSK